MKHINLFLAITVTIATVPINSASFSDLTKNLNARKKSLTTDITQFAACIRGDKNCDPQKIKIYRTITAIIAALAIGGTGYFVVKQRKIFSSSKSLNDQLFKAAKGKDANKVIALLNAGAQINALDKYEGNVLFNVTTPEMAELLIANGANVNAVNNNGDTPLIVAVRRKNLPMVEFFITKKADIAIPNRDGQTALAIAKLYGATAISELLQKAVKPIENKN